MLRKRGLYDGRPGQTPCGSGWCGLLAFVNRPFGLVREKNLASAWVVDAGKIIAAGFSERNQRLIFSLGIICRTVNFYKDDGLEQIGAVMNSENINFKNIPVQAGVILKIINLDHCCPVVL